MINQRAKGTGGCISKTLEQLFSSMHSYLIGGKWDIKVRGEGVIGAIGVSEIVVEYFFGAISAMFYLALFHDTPNTPITPSPRTFMSHFAPLT